MKLVKGRVRLLSTRDRYEGRRRSRITKLIIGALIILGLLGVFVVTATNAEGTELTMTSEAVLAEQGDVMEEPVEEGDSLTVSFSRGPYGWIIALVAVLGVGGLAASALRTRSG